MAQEFDDDLGQCVSLPESPERRQAPSATRLRADVEWGNVEHLLQSVDDVSLAPLDPHIEQQRVARYEADFEIKPVEDETDSQSKLQFSIREILILNTVLAVFFALLRILAPSLVAGTLGIVTLLTAVLLAACQPENRRVEMAWWCMLLVYVATCVFAVYG